MHLDFSSYQLLSFNVDICIRVSFFFPVYLFGCSSTLGFILGVSSCISNDNDLINFRERVNMIETNLDGLISPSSVDTNLVQKLNEISWFGFKIGFFQEQLWPWVIISINTDHNLKRAINFPMLERIIQPGECLLDNIFNLIEHTLHRWRPIQRYHWLTN